MTTNLDNLFAELSAAKADLEQWERLASASERVKALTAAFDKARAAQTKVAEDAAAAVRNRISDVRVTAAGVLGADEGNVLRNSWRISWTAPQFDMHTMSSPPRLHEVGGFAAVPADVLTVLIEKHPEQVPAQIMALRPGDPAGAIEEYFRAKKRGYVRGGASA